MKIITYILVLLMLATSALAFNMPHPIYGSITSDGFAVKGAELEVRNLDTNVKALTNTNDQGFYQVDLGNIDDRYHDGDVIQVTLTYCANQAICKKTVAVSGGANKLSWDLVEENAPALPRGTEIIKYQCSDGSLAASVSACPEEKEETNSLAVGLSILSAILAIALGILGKFKWGKGFVGLANYYRKKGDEAKERGDLFIAEKHYKRAASMVSTAIRKAKDGFYK